MPKKETNMAVDSETVPAKNAPKTAMLKLPNSRPTLPDWVASSPAATAHFQDNVRQWQSYLC